MYDQQCLEYLIVCPVCLAQTPNSVRLTKMDVLSEVLRVVRLEGALFFNGEFSAPWCLSEPRSTAIAPYLSATSTPCLPTRSAGSLAHVTPPSARLSLLCTRSPHIHGPSRIWHGASVYHVRGLRSDSAISWESRRSPIWPNGG